MEPKSLTHDDLGDPAEDVTERKQSESTRSHLAAIVESSPDAILSTANDGTIVSWNDGSESLFGYTAEEAIGATYRMLIPEREWEIAQQAVAKITKGELVQHFETTRRHKDGHLVDVSITLAPIRDENGQIQGTSAIAP